MLKSNQLLLGVILLLIGVLSLITYYFDINRFSVMTFLGGSAFILLYRTKRKTWSLIIGMYVLYMGFASLFLKSQHFLSGFFSPVFFILPGITFLILYLDKNKKGLLIPGSILIWIGIFMILKHGFGLNIDGLFQICVGSAFITMYLLGQRRKWMLIIGFVFYGLAVIKHLNITIGSIPLEILPPLASIAIIAFSVIIIVRAAIMRK